MYHKDQPPYRPGFISALTKNTGVSFGWLLVLLVLTSQGARSQASKTELYQLRITTTAAKRINGLLISVNESTLYLENEYSGRTQIPLSTVRKVRVRTYQPQTRTLAGAVAGGLLVAYITNRDLQNGSPRSPVLYGVTLVFATAGGAAAGGVVGKLAERIGQKHLTFRSSGDSESVTRLQRQLEPYGVTYQNNLIR